MRPSNKPVSARRKMPEHDERPSCGVAASYRNAYGANLVSQWRPALMGGTEASIRLVASILPPQPRCAVPARFPKTARTCSARRPVSGALRTCWKGWFQDNPTGGGDAIQPDPGSAAVAGGAAGQIPACPTGSIDRDCFEALKVSLVRLQAAAGVGVPSS